MRQGNDEAREIPRSDRNETWCWVMENGELLTPYPAPASFGAESCRLPSERHIIHNVNKYLYLLLSAYLVAAANRARSSGSQCEDAAPPSRKNAPPDQRALKEGT